MPANEQTFSHFPTWPLPVLTDDPRSDPPRLTVSARTTCGYLPERLSLFRAFEAGRLSGDAYQRLLDAGFRRSGTLVYQPMCPGCRECVPIRIPVDRFVASRSQRRVLRKNTGLAVSANAPAPSTEKFELYDRYQRQWHDGKQAGDLLGYLDFLYQSPVNTVEFEYRDPALGTQVELQLGGRLLGVGICDLMPRALSSVYFYFDPEFAYRSLGTFSALYEITWAKEHGLAHWYAGYWVNHCRTMHYKARFQPAQLLGTDGIWRDMHLPLRDEDSPA
jgi:arginine-tRNA-protein transferase